MTTARILDSGREPPIAGLVPEPRLVSCPKGDSGGCIIVTIELPDSRSYSSETAPRSLSLCICVGLSVRAARENLGFGGAPPESILGCYSDARDGGSRHFRRGGHSGEAQLRSFPPLHPWELASLATALPPPA